MRHHSIACLMPPKHSHAVAAVLAFGLTATTPATAQVYGSLANFDAVNDTGQVAHGFEIRIEDPTYDRSKLASVFGLDRNFGVPPTSVERYGAPTIEVLPGIGVSVRYAASFAGGLWSAGTPSGPYPFAGDSCWPLGNPAYAGGALTCDHFGVSTFGTPAKVSYAWLVDSGGNTGSLTAIAAAIPAVAFAYTPPPPAAPPAPRPVVAEIDAHKEAGELFGPAYWVKVFANHLDHDVQINDLVHGNANVPADAQVETEWEIFQAGDKNERKINALVLGAADAALVVRYEFYRYAGPLDAFGEALCGGGGHGNGHGPTPQDCGGLGDYVGAQIAGFNAVQPPVPEPGTWALLGAGLATLAFARRARRIGDTA